jgi:hypothetical protein
VDIGLSTYVEFRVVMSWLSRAGARLVPAGRRDWAEAVWAEAHQVPPGWSRLAWRAGGAWLIAREAAMVRRAGTLLLFGAAAGAAAWSAWPDSAASGAALARVDVIGVLALLAGLPPLARWLLGPPDNRAARRLRGGCYVALLAILPAMAAIGVFRDAVPRSGRDLHTFHAFEGPGVAGTSVGGPQVASVLALLIFTALGLAALLALTARRTRVAPATLSIGVRAGLPLGAAMFAVDPLGVDKYVTAPWLHGTMTDTVPAGWAQWLVRLCWILLIGAPLAASFLAALRFDKPGTREQVSGARLWQGTAAALVSNGVGALVVSALGTGLTALLVTSAWVRGVLYHGQHLTASAVYGRELFSSNIAGGYFFMCVIFPLIGAVISLIGALAGDAVACLRSRSRTDDGCLADAGAMQPEIS